MINRGRLFLQMLYCNEMKTEWQAAAERISQPHKQMNNDITIADVEVAFLHLKQVPVESGLNIMTEWCALFTPF